jgi:exosortase A-associated hydrolase 2
MEECFFFKNSTYNLFGCLHKPDQSERQNGIGLVICSPFAEEKLWSHRVIVNCARYLCDNGFSVLRFDFMGHGDSEGNFVDCNIQTCLSDIECAMDIIKDRAQIKQLGLLGLRLGATLAALFAEKKLSPDFIILWEPIVQVETYLKQYLRSNLTTQMANYKEIKYTREQMISDLLSGLPVNIDGYLMSAEYYQQASSVDLGKLSLNYFKPTCLVHISKSGSEKIPKSITELYQNYYQLNSKTELKMVKEKPFWSDVKAYYQKAESLSSSTLRFLEQFVAKD